jgi:hypothetical protein
MRWATNLTHWQDQVEKAIGHGPILAETEMEQALAVQGARHWGPQKQLAVAKVWERWATQLREAAAAVQESTAAYSHN